ncbi:MAG: biotin/lipoyl-binding protein [Pirellulales bacterium]|nr:biotin/lipoyl-binding protein [Pirellulales bacterium]
MSIEQPLDPHLIEQTKQQIRSLVAEISELSKSDVAPEEFYGQFLPRVVSALAAIGGAVWTINPEGRLALQYQINIQETRLRENEERQAQHGRLLYKVLSDGKELLVPPRSGPGEIEQSAGETPAANPTDYLLVFGILKTDLETVGLVEIFQRSEVGLKTQQGYLRFLGQMCELAGGFLKSHQLRHFSDRQVLWTQLEDFTRAVHASLDPRETAYTIANEGRRLIECDRLSVAIRKGSKCRIEAISGQDLFDKRSNTVRLLGKLSTAVVATGEAIWYTGDTRDLAPQVEDAVQEYVDDAHSKSVAVLPLQRPAPPEEDDAKKRSEPPPPIGALIVERIEDSRLAPQMVHRAEVVRQHSATALANAMEHQNLFLMPVWRALGKARWVVEARTLPKTLGIGGGVLLMLLILALWPARFTMESRGALEPVDRRDVFAGIDGVVEELKVAHGDEVDKDQLLAKLRNTDLEVALADVQGQRMATSEEWLSYRRESSAGRLSSEEALRIAGKRAELKQKLDSLDAQWKLYKTKQMKLDVRSPMKGQIITWDLRQRLIHRPVQRGQILMRVADPEGPWQLELKMPENRMGPIVEYQQKLYDEARGDLRALLAEEVRARSPEATDEEIGQAVQDELDKVPDEELSAKIAEIYRRRMCDALRPIVAEVADAALRERLESVLSAETYAAARAELAEIFRQADAAELTIDPDLSDRLKALPFGEAPDTIMEVEYILATEPGVTRKGVITEIHRSAEVRGDEGNTVLIKVAIDKEELPPLRPGATVTAKVYCGRRPLGYVVLYDVIAFVRRVWFRYF